MDDHLQRLRRAAATGAREPLLALCRALERASLCEMWTIKAVEMIRDQRHTEWLRVGFENEHGHPRVVFGDPQILVRELWPAAIGGDMESDDLIGHEANVVVGLRVQAWPRILQLPKKPVVVWHYRSEVGKKHTLTISEVPISYGD